MEGAKAFQQELVLKGVKLFPSMQKVLDGFIAGKGGADNPPPEV